MPGIGSRSVNAAQHQRGANATSSKEFNSRSPWARVISCCSPLRPMILPGPRSAQTAFGLPMETRQESPSRARSVINPLSPSSIRTMVWCQAHKTSLLQPPRTPVHLHVARPADLLHPRNPCHFQRFWAVHSHRPRGYTHRRRSSRRTTSGCQASLGTPTGRSMKRSILVPWRVV